MQVSFLDLRRCLYRGSLGRLLDAALEASPFKPWNGETPGVRNARVYRSPWGLILALLGRLGALLSLLGV